MTTTLYDATVRAYIQSLDALSGVLAKGLAHAEGAGVDPKDLTEARLAPDMLPLRYQVQAAAAHSLGAIRGCEAGEFSPPRPYEATFADLQTLVKETREALAALSPDQVNALAGRDVVFRLGERALPFLAEDFLLSFSVPNFYFHTTTAYDLLRNAGAPLAKQDFLGRIRLKPREKTPA